MVNIGQISKEQRGGGQGGYGGRRRGNELGKEKK